jgi:hypothetical protein
MPDRVSPARGPLIEREGLRPATAAKMASLWQRPSSDGDASQARRQFLNSEEISREHLFRRTCQERVLTSATRTRMALNGAVPVTRRRAVGPRKRDNVWPSGHDHLGETNMTMMLGCRPRLAVVIERVSADSLRKTGIFAVEAGDFRRFPPQVGKAGAQRRKRMPKKPGFPAHSHVSREAWAKESNLAMAISKSDALACSRGATEPHLIRTHKHLETFEFREPYQIGGVQSSGEK